MRPRILLTILAAFLMLIISSGYVFAVKRAQSDEVTSRAAEAQSDVEAFERSQKSAAPVPADQTLGFAAPEVPIDTGEVLVINRVPGDDYGKLAVRSSDGSRRLFDKKCIRVHVANSVGLCLAESGISGYRSELLDVYDLGLKETDTWGAALPSRTRVSADGKWASSTMFLSGSSYEDIGAAAATIVEIIDTSNVRRRELVSSYEINSDEPIFRQDGNFWGVTFAQGGEFYVTHGSSEGTQVLKGSVEAKTLEPTGWMGSCPSLSPDGKTLVVKEMAADGTFQLVSIDIASGTRTPLAETRSVDDQIDWLDDATILYALHANEEEESLQPEFDIWSLNTQTPGAEPQLFLPNADSPATYRPY